MKPSQGLRQTLVVTSKAAKACRPSEASFHHPASRQEHEAALGLGVLDDRQLNAVSLGCPLGFLSGIALIHIRELHSLSGDVLHRLLELFNLRAILLIG